MGVLASSAGTSSQSGASRDAASCPALSAEPQPRAWMPGPTRRSRPLHFPGVLSPPVVCGVIRVAAHHGQLFLP